MEDYYTHRNSGHRYQIKKIDDSGDIQLVDADGLTDESHTKIMRIHPHGFGSHSPDDSHMIGIGLGGRRDMLVALGGEHHKHRHKNIPKGDSVLYNQNGDVIRVFKERMDVTHHKVIKISIGQGIKDGGPGEDKDVNITVTENDITLTKGQSSIKIDATTITCNAQNIIANGAEKVQVISPKILLGI